MDISLESLQLLQLYSSYSKQVPLILEALLISDELYRQTREPN